MPIDKNEITHEINNLTVKIKSICSLILSDEDCGLDATQMKFDGDKAIEALIKVWESVKESRK